MNVSTKLLSSFRQLQEVIIDKHVKIIDCPGIVMATGSDAANVALRNCVKVIVDILFTLILVKFVVLRLNRWSIR